MAPENLLLRDMHPGVMILEPESVTADDGTPYFMPCRSRGCRDKRSCKKKEGLRFHRPSLSSNKMPYFFFFITSFFGVVFGDSFC